MKSLVLCNQLSRLKSHLRDTDGPLRYLSLIESRESRLISDYLSQRPGAEELQRGRLYRKRSEGFREKYVQFMGSVNVANHSHDWWALTFTNKNPQSTALCRNMADFLLIVDLLRNDPRPLLVITDNADLVAQTKTFAKKESLEAKFLVKPPGGLKRWLKLHTPGGTVRAAFRIYLIWAFSRRYQPLQSNTDSHLVVVTLTHPRSFSEPNGYTDPYFGVLVDRLAESSAKALVLALMVERPFEQLKRFKTLEFGIPVIPIESCLALKDLLACTLRALKIGFHPLKPQGSLEIDGVDVGCLVKRAVREYCHSGDLFLHLRVFYGASWLAHRIRVDRCLYPFENRSWEKLLLLGMDSASPEIQLVGYQHSSLTKAHTNFMLRGQEAPITPLPHTILTTGEIATAWLERQSNIPSGRFQTACALRRGQSSSALVKNRNPETIRVLLALATSLEEYVAALSFLEQAFSGADGFEVRIRPHPEFPLESALAIAPLAEPVFYSESTGPLAEDLGWTDVVLYASSTVGMEAISAGIPAINLDLGDFLDRDPLSEWDEFKWTAKEPDELIETIRSIWRIPNDRFWELQDRGRQYVDEYLTPATESRLGLFWPTWVPVTQQLRASHSVQTPPTASESG